MHVKLGNPDGKLDKNYYDKYNKYRIPSYYSTRCLDLFLRGAVFRNFTLLIFTAIFYMKLG